MDKLEYVARSLSRGTNKKYETYVINKLSPEDEAKLGKLTALMDELKEHQDDIDYEDLNRRL